MAEAGLLPSGPPKRSAASSVNGGGRPSARQKTRLQNRLGALQNNLKRGTLRLKACLACEQVVPAASERDRERERVRDV